MARRQLSVNYNKDYESTPPNFQNKWVAEPSILKGSVTAIGATEDN